MTGGRTFLLVVLLTMLFGLAFAVVSQADVSQETEDTLLSIGAEGLKLTMDGDCGGTYEQGQPVVIMVTASQDGYLYLFDFDADSNTVSQFFPHPFWDTGEVLQAGVPLALAPEGAQPKMLVSSKPGEGLLFGIVTSEPVNPASVITGEDIGGWWEIESAGAEDALAEGLAILIGALPADVWFATAMCHYTVVAVAESP